MEGLFYNADDGYLEGIVRGYRSSILTNTAYINLTQCETLEGNTATAIMITCKQRITHHHNNTLTIAPFIQLSLSGTGSGSSIDVKLQLSASDYGTLLQNEPHMSTSMLAQKCTDKLVQEFDYIRAHAVAPLQQFLDYMTCVQRAKSIEGYRRRRRRRLSLK